MQLYCLLSAYLNIKLCFTKFPSSQITQWEGCACGDSQWTLVWVQIGSLLLEGELWSCEWQFCLCRLSWAGSFPCQKLNDSRVPGLISFPDASHFPHLSTIYKSQGLESRHRRTLRVKYKAGCNLVLIGQGLIEERQRCIWGTLGQCFSDVHTSYSGTLLEFKFPGPTQCWSARLVQDSWGCPHSYHSAIQMPTKMNQITSLRSGKIIINFCFELTH